jgi:hypothetical protein
MKRFTIVTGICTVILIAVLLIAGCTSTSSSSGVPAASTGTTPQYTQNAAGTPAEVNQAAVSTPLPSQGDQVGKAGNTDLSQATIDTDAVVDPYNSTSQATTMVPDSEDLGDAIP